MASNLKTIDFQYFIELGYQRFDTHSAGITLRDISGIDISLLNNDLIEIIIPSNLHSINTVFLEGFIANTATILKSIENFNNKVKLVGANYNIESSFKDTVRKILNKNVAGVQS